MKRLIFIALLLLGFSCAAATAETVAPDAELAALLQTAHPGYTMAAFDQWGDTAAADHLFDFKLVEAVPDRERVWDSPIVIIIRHLLQFS